MLIALDTCVLVFLLEPLPADPARARRWQDVRSAVGRWQSDGATLFIPAPVTAELIADPRQGAVVMDLLGKRYGQLDVRPFDAPAADIAGQVTRAVLQGPRTDSKRCLKFDAMIFATAVRWKADRLATTDERDFGKYAPHLRPGLAIEIEKADAQLGQLTVLGS